MREWENQSAGFVARVIRENGILRTRLMATAVKTCCTWVRACRTSRDRRIPIPRTPCERVPSIPERKAYCCQTCRSAFTLASFSRSRSIASVPLGHAACAMRIVSAGMLPIFLRVHRHASSRSLLADFSSSFTIPVFLAFVNSVLKNTGSPPKRGRP